MNEKQNKADIITHSEPISIEIGDSLDLHHFNPKEIPDLINNYIALCLEQHLYEIRLIHGKGTGTLKHRVHTLLQRNKNVSSFSDAASGNWGATSVTLKKQT